jgi:glutathione S-transferase
MSLTLWGRPNSNNVQKTLWALDELGLAYEHVALGGSFGGLDDPHYLAMNPNGRVPTLRDGELVVWESHAILRYLAATYGAGELWPVDPKARAVADQWTDWTATTFQPAWIDLFWRVVRTPTAQQDAAAIERVLAATNAALAILDERLAVSPYLGGNLFTYADIAAGVALYRLCTMPISRPELSNFEAWYGRLQQRRAFRERVCISYAELAGRLGF